MPAGQRGAVLSTCPLAASPSIAQDESAGDGGRVPSHLPLACRPSLPQGGDRQLLQLETQQGRKATLSHRRLPARHVRPVHGRPGDETGASDLDRRHRALREQPTTFRGFYPSCGSRLYSRSDKWPTEIHVHAATMTDPDDYRPDAQVVMRSRAKWLDRLPSIPTHDGFQQKPSVHPPAETL